MKGGLLRESCPKPSESPLNSGDGKITFLQDRLKLHIVAMHNKTSSHSHTNNIFSNGINYKYTRCEIKQSLNFIIKREYSNVSAVNLIINMLEFYPPTFLW